MIDLGEFAIEQDNEMLKDIAFQDWATLRVRENFKMPGFDFVLLGMCNQLVKDYVVLLREEYEMMQEAAEAYASNEEKDDINAKTICKIDFLAGVDWYMEKSYSMAEVFSILMAFSGYEKNSASGTPDSVSKFLEQYKK